mgnify:FL=1
MSANWAAVLDHPEVVRRVAARTLRRAAGRLSREDALQEARLLVARAAVYWRPELGPLQTYLWCGSVRPRRGDPYSRPGVVLVSLDELAPRTGTSSAASADRRRSPGWGTWTVGDQLPAPEVDPSVRLDAERALGLLYPRQRYVVLMRGAGYLLREIGAPSCLGPERVRQIEVEAHQRVRDRWRVEVG